MDMREGECRHPRPSEAAAEKNRENCAICSPPTVAISSGLRSACRWDIQFPTRPPVDLTLFTRLMPWANSRRKQSVVGGLRRQLSNR